MKRKPKIKNWLKLFLLWLPIVLIFIWGYYYQFYKSYPIISTPPLEEALQYGAVIIRPLEEASQYDTVTIIDESSPMAVTVPYKNQDVVAVKPLYSVLTGNSNNQLNSIDDENKKRQLEAEINTLELRKKGLEENILKLKEENVRLSKISYDIQEAILKFVERNRVRDTIASAFIGATISVLLAFALTRPTIRKVIDNWLWENIGEK